jgi:hypothetical protein
MPEALTADAKALIDRPNFAHLATLMPAQAVGQRSCLRPM